MILLSLRRQLLGLPMVVDLIESTVWRMVHIA
jgi:hypothetical protein